MSRNIEIKARVNDPAALRERAAKLSDSAAEILHQRDTFYAVREGRLKLREFADGTAELIYYERPDQAGPKASKYTRTHVPDAASTRELLGRVFRVKGVVTKRRELFLVGRTRVHLDEVEGLGSFMELEVVLDEGEADSAGERVAFVLMERLGIRLEDLVEQAYIDLLQTEAVAGAVVQGLQIAFGDGQFRYHPDQIGELSSAVVSAVKSAVAKFFDRTSHDNSIELEAEPITTHHEVLGGGDTGS